MALIVGPALFKKLFSTAVSSTCATTTLAVTSVSKPRAVTKPSSHDIAYVLLLSGKTLHRKKRQDFLGNYC